MDASIVDLRYDMKNIMKALTRNEVVNVYCRNTLMGTIVPATKHATPAKNIKDHPFFGMSSQHKDSVATVMKTLRKGRYHDL